MQQQQPTPISTVEDGQHVSLTCVNHTHLRWSCKRMAWSGFYNGTRSIFYFGTWCEKERRASWQEPECKCPPSDLKLSPEYC